MRFMEAVKTVYFRKFVTFSGRASRSEYWWAYLAYIIFTICGIMLFSILSGAYSQFSQGVMIASVSYKAVLITIFVFIISMIPFIAVQIRRFHDVNMSAWWLFSMYIIIILIIESPDLKDIISNVITIDMTGSGLSTIVMYINMALPLIFLLSIIIVYIITLLKGTNGPNRFGPDPLKPGVNSDIFS